MICPSCGYVMKEDHLYCEGCGAEIQIVPDFEPEIENSITETLSTVAEEINPDKEEAPPESTLTSGEVFLGREEIFQGITAKKKNLITTLLAILMVLVVFVIALFVYQNYSSSYQLHQAEEMIAQEKYKDAVAYLQKVEALQPEAEEIPYMEAQCYYQMGQKQDALDLLLYTVQNRSLNEEHKEQYYGFLIQIYEEDAQYAEINRILLESNDTEIQTHFQHYMAMKPEFGYPTGNYEQVISLKISANTTGKIYYTINGRIPDERSSLYTSPLQLNPGEYRVCAIFINDYGIESEVAENYYLIDVEIPEAPTVSLDSGDYHQPCRIEVSSPSEGAIYYTINGAMPNEDNAALYNGSIEMPLGRTNFRFVVISEEGVQSEVVSRSYDLELETQVTVAKAIENVKRALLEQHVLTDMQGNSPEITGRYVYQYESLVEIPNMGYYYKLSEFIQNGTDPKTSTERLYAVEIYTGTPNRLVYDEKGQMGLIPLNK